MMHCSADDLLCRVGQPLRVALRIALGILAGCRADFQRGIGFDQPVICGNFALDLIQPQNDRVLSDRRMLPELRVQRADDIILVQQALVGDGNRIVADIFGMIALDDSAQQIIHIGADVGIIGFDFMREAVLLRTRMLFQYLFGIDDAGVVNRLVAFDSIKDLDGEPYILRRHDDVVFLGIQIALDRVAPAVVFDLRGFRHQDDLGALVVLCLDLRQHRLLQVQRVLRKLKSALFKAFLLLFQRAKRFACLLQILLQFCQQYRRRLLKAFERFSDRRQFGLRYFRELFGCQILRCTKRLPQLFSHRKHTVKMNCGGRFYLTGIKAVCPVKQIVRSAVKAHSDSLQLPLRFLPFCLRVSDDLL